MTVGVENRKGWFTNRWRLSAWSTAAFLLLLPLLAMQFTDEVSWDAFDFAFFGALLIGVGITFELAVRRSGDLTYRAAIGVALGAAFLLVWASGAVGIMGDSGNPANLLFFAVLAVGISGALLARFQPRGMSRALIATAVAQLSVAVIALITGWGSSGPLWLRDISIFTGLFSALWLFSSWLLWKSASRRPVSGSPGAPAND